MEPLLVLLLVVGAVSFSGAPDTPAPADTLEPPPAAPEEPTPAEPPAGAPCRYQPDPPLRRNLMLPDGFTRTLHRPPEAAPRETLPDAPAK